MGNRARQLKKRQKDLLPQQETHDKKRAKKSKAGAGAETVKKNDINVSTFNSFSVKSLLNVKKKKSEKKMEKVEKNNTIIMDTIVKDTTKDTMDTNMDTMEKVEKNNTIIMDTIVKDTTKDTMDTNMDTMDTNIMDDTTTAVLDQVESASDHNDNDDNEDDQDDDDDKVSLQLDQIISDDDVLEDEFDGENVASDTLELDQNENDEEEKDDDDISDTQIKAMFSDSDQDGDSSEEEETEFERTARLQDEQDLIDHHEAEKELRDQLEERERLVIPDLVNEEDEDEQGQLMHTPEDPSILQSRISEVIRILSNFKELRDPAKGRSEYTALLVRDLAAYYGYNAFLAELLFHLFPLQEIVEFFEANEVPRPVVIRTNTLKTRRRELAQSLISRGVNLEPIGKWSKVGIQVFDSPVPIGATPEYLAGHYMLQAASSFLPVMALSPLPGEKVLDMCAAPGGKTTYIAQIMQNTGVLVANDVNKDRMKALVGNLHRLGVRNAVVTNQDGRMFPGVGGGGFDRILLDAPCSGTGVISKDASVKTNKSESDISFLTHTQKELVLSAIDALGDKGVLVYSTCALTVQENEAVVQYALTNRPEIRLVDPGLSFGVEGFTAFRGQVFSEDMKLCRRYYPHTHNMDGFFVAKLVKDKAVPKQQARVASGTFGKKKSKKEKKSEKEAAAAGRGQEKQEGASEQVVGFDEQEDAVYLDFSAPTAESDHDHQQESEPEQEQQPVVAEKKKFNKVNNPKKRTRSERQDNQDDDVVEILSRAEKKMRKKEAMARLGLARKTLKADA